MIKILQKDYPVGLYSWKKVTAISGFIALFLLLFQPFGLGELPFGNRVWIVLGYGIVTFLIIAFNQFVLPRIIPALFKEKYWTVLKQIIWLFWNVLFIAVGNFYYSAFIFDIPINRVVFLLFLFYTVLTAALPISISTFVYYNRMLKNNLEKSALLNEKLTRKINEKEIEEEIALYSANEKEWVKTSISNLLFVESSGNYVTVWWLANGEIQEKTLRNTLINMERRLENSPSILRTHKAFLVNLHHVKKVDGNAQGYKLALNFLPAEVPVSRTHIKNFNAAMGSL